MQLRRAITTLFLAGALAAVPVAAASAYEADEYEVGISTTTPTVGGTFTVTVGGPAGNPTITLTISSPDVPDGAISIAGTKALTKATTDGFASFSVTLSEPGTYSLVATDADGTVLSSQQIVAVAESAAGGGSGSAAGGAGSTQGSRSGSGLAETGGDQVLLVGGAALLVVGGATAVLVARNRRKAGSGV